MTDFERSRQQVSTARKVLSDATQLRIRRVCALAKAREELEKQRREYKVDHAVVKAADKKYQDALKDLNAARISENTARDSLNKRLMGLAEPEDAIASLQSDYPIVMLPVRMETRFVRFSQPRVRHGEPNQVGELWVRIYPDGIMSDMHEPLLSDIELQAGRDYWETAWRNADEQDAWTALVSEVGAARAAWIVEQCKPTNMKAFPTEPITTSVIPEPRPVFDELETRPANSRRAPIARLLPDRWVVQAYPDVGISEEERNKYRVTSKPVKEPLALSFAFDGDAMNATDREQLSDNLKVDKDIKWTLDFDEAEDVGMAVRIPLIERDFNKGFSRVLVLGVNTSLSPQESAEQLNQLLENHRYTRGFAFVKQGTATNSTVGKESGYPPPDPRATESFRVERGGPLTQSGSDGALFMKALGLSTSAADHVAGADRDEQVSARAMACALWPATLGYFMKQMMASEIDAPAQAVELADETIEQLRTHFLNYVRGRGPLPAFGVGDVPYGILPVSTLGSGSVPGLGGVPGTPPRIAEDAVGLDKHMPTILWQLRQSMTNLAEQYAPRVGKSANPDTDLMNTFRMHASSREIYIRPAVGEATVENMAGFAGAGGDADKIHEPININDPINLGGPIEFLAKGLTLKSLFELDDSFPDVIGGAERDGINTPIGPDEGGRDG